MMELLGGCATAGSAGILPASLIRTRFASPADTLLTKNSVASAHTNTDLKYGNLIKFSWIS
jgi:hypothetical protein